MAVVSALFSNPLESVKVALRGWKDVIGAYRFFNNEKVSIASILQPHREAALERIKQHKRALIIQDKSELGYTQKTKLKGKGPLSTVHRTGFFSHNHFIVTPEGIPIGVWDTKIYARDDAEHGKSKDRKKKAIEEKESNRWLEGYRRACHLADLAPETQIISCSDREGDIYEVFEELHQRRKKGVAAAEILIRSCYDRKIVPGSQGDEGKIFAKLSAAPLLGTVDIYVKKKIHSKKDKTRSHKKTVRSARTAVLEIRAIDIMLAPPYRSDRKLSEVAIHVVMAKEKSLPDEEDPICWVLLTSIKADDFESNLKIVRLYAERWEICIRFRVKTTGYMSLSLRDK